MQASRSLVGIIACVACTACVSERRGPTWQTPSPQRSTVLGTVTDANSAEPLVGAIVHVADLHGEQQLTATTDEGAFRIDNLKAGLHTIVFYYGNAKATQLVDIDRGFATRVDVRLDDADDGSAAAPQFKIAAQLPLPAPWLNPWCEDDTGHFTAISYAVDESLSEFIFRDNRTLNLAAMCFQGIGQCSQR